MYSGELFVSNDALIRIILVISFVPVVLMFFWQLFPRLSPTGKRLAGGTLVLTLLVIVAALEYRPKSGFEVWLWNLEQEWNIPTTLTSTQLAMVGGIALVTAWLAKARPTWQRLYLVAIGLIFPYLALDEYLKLHEHRLMAIDYDILGAVDCIDNYLWRCARHAGHGYGTCACWRHSDNGDGRHYRRWDAVYLR